MTDLRETLKARTSARVVYNEETGELLGLFNEWRQENPNTDISSRSKFGTFRIGHIPLTDYAHEKDARKRLGLEELHETMKANHAKQQAERYAEAEKIAKPILDRAEAEINKVLARHGVTIEYCMEGDTHGIYNDYQYIGVTVNGFHFERKI